MSKNPKDTTQEKPTCGQCNGSGEGQHEGSKCTSCGGTGVKGGKKPKKDNYVEESSTEHIQQFLQHSAHGRTDDAYASFNSALMNKISSRLEDIKVDIAQQTFGFSNEGKEPAADKIVDKDIKKLAKDQKKDVKTDKKDCDDNT